MVIFQNFEFFFLKGCPHILWNFISCFHPSLHFNQFVKDVKIAIVKKSHVLAYYQMYYLNLPPWNPFLAF
jgi:hypothetical protein